MRAGRTPLWSLTILALVAYGTGMVGHGVGRASASAGSCGDQWSVTTLARGFGPLENLAFDGQGGLLLSETNASGPGALRRLYADGSRDTAVPSVNGPGGIVAPGSPGLAADGRQQGDSGRIAFYTTGNNAASGVLGRPDGTIEALDLDSGQTRTIARGLTMPNGLAKLPDGSFVVTRDLGANTGLTRVTPDGRPQSYGPRLKSTNGAMADPRSRRLVVSTTFTASTRLVLIDIDRPEDEPKTIRIPGAGPVNAADDLTIGANGRIYLALNLAGKVVEVDAESGQVCTIARGLPFASSVRFGAGPGWDTRSLYVTGFLGTVTRLSPPEGR